MALTSEEVRKLRGEMERRREALIAELRQDYGRAQEEQYGALAGPSSDTGDQSVASLIAELDQAEITRDVLELRELEAARKRLASGAYGACADCAGEIGYERLCANPTALRCIACQERYEKTFAGAGRASL